MFYRRRKANRAALLPSEDSTQLGNHIVCFSFYVYYPATEDYLLTFYVQKKNIRNSDSTAACSFFPLFISVMYKHKFWFGVLRF